ncbi:MAG: Asp-tRNA(Asn)/Glu-tRNA(Gln) amidotransferase subunit GatC [Candidatus Pacebacteria bacterium]|nr:Asp-tRNA(Asn)/Glu-tRNA(Gln) amidotransferase subunit GatC [Candidatus Paceibacterota bacterium]
MIELKEIDKLAELSRVEMTAEEKKGIQKDLESILGYISEIQEVTTDSVGSPEERLNALHNVMREDDNPNEEGIYTEKIIKSAPKSEKGYIKVKKIL